jgi:DNA-directed RNA polymerase specialized sigma24 family protein
MTVSIDQLIDKHKHWIAVVKRFGEIAYAEDIVQEAYIKIINSNKDANFAYFYFTLRSLTMNLHNKKVIKVEITKDIEHLLLDSQEDDIILELAQPFIDYIQTWEDYERMLFMVYVNKGVSMRKMSRESGISFTSIYNTIKNCKKKLITWQKENHKD